jgi:hypothetical protein
METNGLRDTQQWQLSPRALAVTPKAVVVCKGCLASTIDLKI